MKNICIFGCDFQSGGATSVAVKMANELSRYHNVYFLAAADSDSTLWGKEHISSEVKYHNFGLANERILKLRLKTAPLFRKFVKENDIDIVFSIGYYAAFFIAPLLSGKSRCKYVYCEHGAPANQMSDKKATIMRKINVHAYDMTVALTKRSERDFVSLIGARADRVTTIPNWINSDDISEDAVYNKDSKKLLTIGRISDEKGFDMLVDIARVVLSRHTDWQWHIMGDGPDREKIEKMISEAGLSDKIILLGNVAGATAYFDQYSVVCLTSYREGLPLVLLEAKAKKLPCVSFDVVTGPSEIIRDGVNGYLIPCYDKEMYANKLCSLIESREKRERFSENAMLDLERFEKGNIMKLWLSLTERLTEKK